MILMATVVMSTFSSADLVTETEGIEHLWATVGDGIVTQGNGNDADDGYYADISSSSSAGYLALRGTKYPSGDFDQFPGRDQYENGLKIRMWASDRITLGVELAGTLDGVPITYVSEEILNIGGAGEGFNEYTLKFPTLPDLPGGVWEEITVTFSNFPVGVAIYAYIDWVKVHNGSVFWTFDNFEGYTTDVEDDESIESVSLGEGKARFANK